MDNLMYVRDFLKHCDNNPESLIKSFLTSLTTGQRFTLKGVEHYVSHVSDYIPDEKIYDVYNKTIVIDVKNKNSYTIKFFAHIIGVRDFYSDNENSDFINLYNDMKSTIESDLVKGNPSNFTKKLDKFIMYSMHGEGWITNIEIDILHLSHYLNCRQLTIDKNLPFEISDVIEAQTEIINTVKESILDEISDFESFLENEFAFKIQVEKNPNFEDYVCSSSNTLKDFIYKKNDISKISYIYKNLYDNVFKNDLHTANMLLNKMIESIVHVRLIVEGIK